MHHSSDFPEITAALQGADNLSGDLEDDTCTFSIYSDHQSNLIQVQFKSYWESDHFKHSERKTEFIWHCGYPPSLKSIDTARLDGSLNYGISLSDEWFLVWCLFEISKKFDCQIQVYDNDGEFLLIEVADHLPRWITPDLAKGRVWIKAGSLHLIPPELTPSTHGPLSTDAALEILRSTSVSTIASESINSSLMNRIHIASPQALTENHLFNTEAYLHIDISKALQADPNLIGLAVKAFCEKDADSFKVCREMRRFPPQKPLNPKIDSPNAETTSLPYLVRMTRPLYAILLNHESTFHPPKPFEKAGWMDFEEEKTSEWTRRLVGMKIACGFEMMLAADDLTKKNDGTTFQKPPRRYQLYLDKLQKCGYFQNELKGSAKWVELEAIAMKAYLNSLKPTEIVKRFETATSNSDLAGSNLISEDCRGESDEWLSLNEAQLKSLFKESDPNSTEADLSSLKKDQKEDYADMKRMSDFTSQVEKFVDTQGSLEGALHSDDEISSDSDSDITSSEDSEQEALRANIFPSKSRSSKNTTKSSTQDTLVKQTDEERQKRLATIVPGLSDGEWGRSTQQPDNSRDANNPSSLVDTVPIVTQETVNTTSTKMKKSLPRLSEQSYDGVCEESSCDESDGDNLDKVMEDHPDAEMMNDIDMDAERDDFLKFAREALGLTSEQYEAILDDRRERGAYVPPTRVAPSDKDSGKGVGDDSMSGKPVDPNDFLSSSSSFKGKERETLRNYYSSTVEEDKSDMSEDDKTDEKIPDMNLDTFDKLMNRMEEELKKGTKPGGPILSTGLGPNLGGDLPLINHQKVKSEHQDDSSDSSEPEMMDEINKAMKSELADLMKGSGVDLDGHTSNHHLMNYSLISDFLESYKSQAGLPGPVGNIAGRIGFNLHSQNHSK